MCLYVCFGISITILVSVQTLMREFWRSRRKTQVVMFPLGHADSPPPVNGINGHSDDTDRDSVPKASLRLGFSEYCRISNLIVLHLRKMEEGEAPRLSHSHKPLLIAKIVFCQERG